MKITIYTLLKIGVGIFILLQLLFFIQVLNHRMENNIPLQMVWLYLNFVPHLTFLMLKRKETILENKFWVLGLFTLYYMSIHALILGQDIIYVLTNTSLSDQFLLSFWILIPLQILFIALLFISIKSKPLENVLHSNKSIDFKTQIRNVISKDKIEDAFILSLKYFQDDDKMVNGITLLNRSWHEVNQKESLGILDFEVISITKAKIINGLLEITQVSLDDNTQINLEKSA